MNSVHLLGNLTRAPQVKFLANEKCLAHFTIAHNRTWKDASGQKQEEVSFVDCTAFGKTAELIGQYFEKGQAILVEGRLKQESWEKDGEKRSKLALIVEAFHFLPRATKAGESKPAEGKPAAAAAPVTEDDAPF